jgi:hypothetical protein
MKSGWVVREGTTEDLRNTFKTHNETKFAVTSGITLLDLPQKRTKSIST